MANLSEETSLRNAPAGNADLFVSFNWLALQGFGGVLAVVQRELVEKKKWLTLEEFVEDWSVAQILPGPNVINLALMIGGRHFGWRGALSALAGLLLVPTVLVLIIASLIAGVADSPAMQGALRGMGAVSAGLIMALLYKITRERKLVPIHVLLGATYSPGISFQMEGSSGANRFFSSNATMGGLISE